MTNLQTSNRIRFQMIRKIAFSLVVLLSCQTTTGNLWAQTAEELQSRGLSHFRKAHYEAVPRGDKAQAQTEFALAEKAFTNAIQRRPGRLGPYLYLGRTYFVQKKYAQAAETYRAALKIEPQKKEVYLKLASSQEMAGDYAGAIDTLKRLRELETDARALQILEDFTQRLEKKAQSETVDQKPR